MPGKFCQLNRSTQHSREVHWLESTHAPECLKISKAQDATSPHIAFWQIRPQAIRKLNRFKGG